MLSLIYDYLYMGRTVCCQREATQTNLVPVILSTTTLLHHYTAGTKLLTMDL
jgi:hypothetical protein